ncbi:MAG: Mth938-like domain-containing protein [Fodinibius sp.]|nr:Mth938-like domain-containing protein [Fodinibius sp.]
MNAKNISPTIHSIEWGTIITEKDQSYKDAKLFPGGSRAWDWNETDTHHEPGIQPADVEELLEHGADVVVLSQGFHERLQVCNTTKEMLDNNGVEYYILETGKAAQKYNQLCKEHAVGALIHSTC